jgi:hypothetical protein
MAQGIGMEIAPPDIDQVLHRLPRERGTDALETGIRAEPKQTQQEPTLQGGGVEGQAGPRTGEMLRKPHAQIRLFEHIEETRHGPPLRDL